ncbi:MAG: rhodanese-like domain-containing protein [Rhodoferax sp.]|uniref:rhodanese-like domain-containing protein n=1 Tax=Rhodoferax sp. TaxID=50421 RepID=UPI001400606B|nr:rhodanese-like domain-containing protein [Rhodoferax sp.]NDP37912.1 rhodanese-like domain-containing protein [Rhodoferax sp.]
MSRLIVLALVGAAWGLCAQAEDNQPLRITKLSHEFVVQTPDGPLVITRAKRAGSVTKGFIQPLVPQPGVTPVTEIDVLHALNDPSTMVIDMRDEDEPLGPTIPNSYHIPYNELEDRMAELGCQQRGKNQWDCTSAFKIVAFCHGPMCVQSPAGIASLVRMGFPVNKISYYRGGMMDWQGLGLTTASSSRPTTR